MRVSLNVIAGPQTGRTFSFDQHDTFMIGRSEDVHFCLPHDRFFSRHHCLIEIAPPQAFLRDLGSTNGTFVNGQRIESVFLKSGDRIQGGETILEVQVTSADQIGFQTFRQPSIIGVQCLNCGLLVEVEASMPDSRMTYLCDECRDRLKENPAPIPNYQMIRILGKGGMGSVVLARSELTGRAVAIKTLLPEVAVSDQSVKRFLREIEVAATVKHPHVVEYIEHGSHNGTVYLITEFVNGMDAGKLAKHRGGRLNVAESIAIMTQTLSALDHAHELGFVHRDIKEQNILVDGEGSRIVAKLTDFGLSKSFQETGMSGVTMVGDVAGTIAYMPPEQVKDFKEVRPPSDIYAAGMTAYSLLTGAHPFDLSPKAGIAETVKAIFEKPVTPLTSRRPDVHRSIATVIEIALEKEPSKRWRTAAAMRDALLNASSMS